MPASILASLRGMVIYSTDHSFTVSGDSLANSLVSFRARAFSLVNPIPGSSKDGSSVIPFLCNLVGVSASSLPSAVGAGAVCSARGSGSVAAHPPPPPGFACLPSVASSVSTHSCMLSAAVPPFSSLFPPPPPPPPASFAPPPLPSFYPVTAPVAPSVAPVVSIPSSFLLFALPVRPCLPSMLPGAHFPLDPPLAAASSSFLVSSLLSSAPPASSSFLLSFLPSVPLSPVAALRYRVLSLN